MQELVNCDRLLCEHTRPRQVAQVLVGDAEVVVHLADAAQILELAGHVDRLGVVLDSLGVAVLADVDGAETPEDASFQRSVGRPQPATGISSRLGSRQTGLFYVKVQGNR